MTSTPSWQDVLDFWFLPADDADHLAPRAVWFAKDDAFDTEIRTRFGALVRAALADGLREWEATPPGALARILLLDQFTRNLGRGSADAFAGDAHALALAERLIGDGRDLQLPAMQRQFVYLPLMHAENREAQVRCVALYEDLFAEDPRLETALDFARQHRDIIERFGRFPHRNAALGRTTSAAEAEFLAQPGSSF